MKKGLRRLSWLAVFRLLRQTGFPDEEGIKTPPPASTARGHAKLDSLMKKGLRPSAWHARCWSRAKLDSLMKKGLRPLLLGVLRGLLGQTGFPDEEGIKTLDHLLIERADVPNWIP